MSAISAGDITVGYNVPGMPIARNDILAVGVFAPVAAAGSFLWLTGRLITTQGELIHFAQQLTFPFTTQKNFLALTDGWLQSFSIDFDDSDGNMSLCYVRVDLFRGSVQQNQARQGLLAGYVDSMHGLHWPEGETELPNRESGSVQIFPVASPAAGVNWSVTFAQWTSIRLGSVRARLTAAALSTLTSVRLEAVNNVTTLWRLESNSVPGIGSSTGYSIAVGAPQIDAIVSDTSIPLPDMWLPPASKIQMIASGLGAADQWDQIVLVGEQRLQVNSF